MQNIANSYVFEGKPTEAVRAFDDLSSQAKQEGFAGAAVGAHLDAARVLADAGKGTEAIQQAEQAQALARDASSLPQAVQARLEAESQLARARGLGAQGKYDEARAAIDNVRGGIEQRAMPAEVRSLHEVQGALALRQKNYQEAVTQLQQADQHNPRVIYQLAVANEGLGHDDQASQLFAKAANWNTGGLDYALVRSDAMQKAGEKPVATSGKKKPGGQR